MQSDPDNYREFDRALSEAGVSVAAAELHGGLCGMLCAGGAAAARDWIEQCLDEASGGTPAQIGELRAVLTDLERRTRASLDGGEMSFHPWLPDDDDTVEFRVEALALWCHGFLAGLGLGGMELGADAGDDTEELTEIVSDIAEISKAVVEADSEGGDGAEGFAVAELIEYVRVGVQFVYESLSAPQPPDSRMLH